MKGDRNPVNNYPFHNNRVGKSNPVSAIMITVESMMCMEVLRLIGFTPAELMLLITDIQQLSKVDGMPANL